MKASQSRTSIVVLVLSFIVACVCVFNLPAVAQTNDKVAKEVIAITKAEWAAMLENRAEVGHIADEYTEFNSTSPTRLDGKELTTRLFEADLSGSGASVAAEMANEKVQVYGDVAILTYNYIGRTKDKDGKVEPDLAKSTRVYVKKDGKWMLVHANFAPVK